VIDPETYVFDPADYETRHPSTVALLRWFEYDHLAGEARVASQVCHEVAHEQVRRTPDGPELTAGLRKLLEAKDCFVRASIEI
jgi:hypothetical protein